jgi:hypothetical protein
MRGYGLLPLSSSQSHTYEVVLFNRVVIASKANFSLSSGQRLLLINMANERRHLTDGPFTRDSTLSGPLVLRVEPRCCIDLE